MRRGKRPIASGTYKTWTGDGGRINMVVSIQAKAKLKRLATHYGVTQRELLARVLADAETMVVDGLGRVAQNAYYDVTR